MNIEFTPTTVRLSADDLAEYEVSDACITNAIEDFELTAAFRHDYDDLMAAVDAANAIIFRRAVMLSTKDDNHVS